MSWDFLTWLVAFILQAALLGRSMYSLIALTDLEQDLINPYDLSNQLNRYVAAEYVAQCLLTAVLLACGKWFIGGVQLAITLYMVQMYMKRQVYIDATDAFKQLKPQKLRRSIVFGLYCFTFVFVTYRLIESALHTLLTPEGRASAKKLFQEAAASLHGY